MPTTESGDDSTVANSLVRTVTGATNATPIVITTSVAHLFANDDRVTVASVGGNTAANGTWKITWLSSTTFSLDTSVGNGVYTSGGTATDTSLTPSFTIPSDGDDLDAASVNVALETLADRTQFLALALGMKSKVFTANGTWNSPADCGAIGFVDIYGGGGGGGGAGPSGTTSTQSACGGSGGACSQRRLVPVPLAPSTAYAVVIGIGGTAGPIGAVGVAGSPASFKQGATTLAIGSGGSRGGGSSSAATATSSAMRGGSPLNVDGTTSGKYYNRVTVVNPGDFVPPMNGGGASFNAVTETYAMEGGYSEEEYAGSAGANGGTVVGYLGGGGGGGGGGGHTASGGAGGAGGAGNNAGTGVAGTVGGAAPVNSGGGGGGGGAGGQGSAAGGAAAAGGAGGSGKVTIYYFGSAT